MIALKAKMQDKLVSTFKTGDTYPKNFQGSNNQLQYDKKAPDTTSTTPLASTIPDGASTTRRVLTFKLRSLDTKTSNKASVTISQAEVAKKASDVIFELQSSQVNLHQYDDPTKIISDIVEFNVRDMNTKTKIKFDSMKTEKATIRLPVTAGPTYTKVSANNYDFTCMAFDTKSSLWKGFGCQDKGTSGYMFNAKDQLIAITCECEHLSEFGVSATVKPA